MLMVIVVLIFTGLCFGSFINALVWRQHESSKIKKKGSKSDNLSIVNGRSMCPNCRHQLATEDLLPIISWLWLKGRCRYCNSKISVQYPIVEALTSLLFVASYLFWPYALNGSQIPLFILWLPILTGLIALAVYDAKWQVLPTKIIYGLYVFAIPWALITILSSPSPLKSLLNTALAVLIGGGLFYLLYLYSKGKWIGGGDVRLGYLLGLIAGTPARSILFIFIASLIGSIVGLSLIATKHQSKRAIISFGPFLIIGLFLLQLFGHSILHHYQQAFFPFTT